MADASASAMTIDPVDVVEALYQVRLSLEACASPVMGSSGARLRSVRDGLRRIDEHLTRVLRNVGVEPGTTSDDADTLKLTIMHAPRDAFGGRVIVKQVDKIEALLYETADIGGGDYTRQLGRFAEFYHRANFVPLIPDDPEFPVQAYCREHDVNTHDLTQMAVAFRDWTRMTCAAFLASRGMGPAPSRLRERLLAEALKREGSETP